ncbi:DUF5305 family protein [Thermococcus sp. 21S7]|uniref:DUF5305 family protein n=1 Tax=Thermococcus sp. 21S7 TaxID=1638221 RepID=UPI001438D07A|nr:DUF5305 family protein [Thermococcus sp. 21S7]NJE62017.1 hypothetical protein [Thermococcus sp. 21S7]
MKNVKIDREKLILGAIAVSLILAGVFGIYGVIAYTTEPTTIKATYDTVYTERGELIHSGFFTNETVYKDGTSLEYYPAKITSAIAGEYTYKVTPEKNGKYSVTLHREYYVTSGKKRINITNTTEIIKEGSFTGTFSVPTFLNMTEIQDDLTAVQEGTGLYRAQVDVYFKVDVEKSDGTTFTQRISLVRDVSGMVKLEGADKEYKKVVRHVNTTINTVSFLGKEIPVSTARSVFPIGAILFAIPPIGFAYTHRERKPDELKNLRKFIVEGAPSDVGAVDPVDLRSVRDLERVFDLVDKPIVHYRQGNQDVYAIIDGDIIYEYRKPLPPEGDEAN